MDRDTLTSTPISRRNVLAGGALAGMAAFLAACGTKGTATTAPESAAPTRGRAVGLRGRRSQRGRLGPGLRRGPGRDARRPSSTGRTGPTTSTSTPTTRPSTRRIDGFTAKYGTTVHYQEVIEGNEDFVATIKPALQSGKDTGWDLITLTDWMAAKLIGLDWIEAFEPANVPNLIANIKDVYVNVPWDPNVSQARAVALRHDRPRLRQGHRRRRDQPRRRCTRPTRAGPGKVEYLTEMRDAVGLSMLYLGLDPANPDAGRLRQGRGADAEGQDRRRRPRRQGPVLHRGPQERRHGRGDGLVGRHGPGADRQAVAPVRARLRGRDALDRQPDDPEGGGPQGHGRAARSTTTTTPRSRRSSPARRRLHLAGQGLR